MGQVLRACQGPPLLSAPQSQISPSWGAGEAGAQGHRCFSQTIANAAGIDEGDAMRREEG